MSEGAAPAGDQGGQGGASAATSAATQVAPVASDWTTGFNDELKGYVQTKGFKDPGSVVESYRQYEKLMGVPKERLLRLPEKDEDPAWGDIWSRLGRPAQASEYQLEVPKEGGDENFANWAKETFFKLNMPRKQAESLVKQWNEYVGKQVSQQAEAQKAHFMQESTSLKKEWGQAHDQNVEIGRRAAREFGFDAETIDKLESSMGYAKVMKLMHALGSKVGEDSFVGGDRNNSSFGGKLTPEQARYRIQALRNDNDFVKRYSSGDLGLREEMERLHKMAYPTD